MKKDISPTQRMMNAYFQQFKGKQSKKVRKAGDWCQKCTTPVVEYVRPEAEQERLALAGPPSRRKKDKFWYAWWLVCPKCGIIYHRPDGKRQYRTWYDDHLSSILREE